MLRACPGGSEDTSICRVSGGRCALPCAAAWRTARAAAPARASADTPAGVVARRATGGSIHAASDDPQKIARPACASRRPRSSTASVRSRRRHAPTAPAAPDPRPPRGCTRRTAARSAAALAHGATVIRAVLARGDFLTMHQSADEIVFDYGDLAPQLHPGRAQRRVRRGRRRRSELRLAAGTSTSSSVKPQKGTGGDRDLRALCRRQAADREAAHRQLPSCRR